MDRRSGARPESTSTQSRDYNRATVIACCNCASGPESTSTQSRDYNTTTDALLIKSCRARININPVEGLQQQAQSGYSQSRQPESTSTQSRDYNWQFAMLGRMKQRQNQHQPSRGITTSTATRVAPAADWPESTSTQSRDYNTGLTTQIGANQEPESTSTQSRDYNGRRV